MLVIKHLFYVTRLNKVDTNMFVLCCLFSLAKTFENYSNAFINAQPDVFAFESILNICV